MRPDLPAVLLALAVVAAPGGASAGALLRPAALAADTYGETFTFVADLDDGGYLQVQLSVTNLGPGSAHGLCRALWVPASGPVFTASDRVGKRGWSHQVRDGAEVLAVGPCRATAGDRLAVEAALDGARVRLAFDAKANPLRPPSPVIRVDGRRHRTELLVAHAPVEATIVRKAGETPHVSRGGGYADHSISDVTPKRLARRWVRFRALRGDGPLLLARESLEGEQRPLWRRDGTAFREGGRFELERNGAGDASAFVARFDGAAGRFAIRSRRPLFRHSPLDDLGALGAVVSPLVGAPVTYTFRAVLEEEGRPPVPGILEVTLAED